jgi:hypothetical protein
LYNERLIKQKEEKSKIILLGHLEAFCHSECNIASQCCKLYVHCIIKEHGLRFDEAQRIGQDKLFVAEYLQCAHKVVRTDQKIYRYRLAPESTTTRRHDLAIQLLLETANKKMVAIYERVAPAHLYRVFFRLITDMLDIATILLRDGQKTEAKGYLREARAMARQICRDRHAPVSVKLKALLKVHFYQLYGVYTQVVGVKRPQAINWIKERKAAMCKDKGERCPR